MRTLSMQCYYSNASRATILKFHSVNTSICETTCVRVWYQDCIPTYSGWTCYNPKRGTSIPPTGICLSPVYTLTASIDGQSVPVLVLVAVRLASLTICGCTLQLLWACNYSHIMLSIIDTSLNAVHDQILMAQMFHGCRPIR